MLNDYERHLALSYLANMLPRLKPKRPDGEGIARWLESDGHQLAGDKAFAASIEESASNAQESKRGWRALCRLVEKESRKAATQAPDDLGLRLRRLGAAVSLSSLDIAILEVLLRYRMQPLIEGVIDAAFLQSLRCGPMNARSRALPCVLGESFDAVRSRLFADAPLVRSGLVTVDDDQDVSPLDRLGRLGSPASEEADVRNVLLNTDRVSELTWADFDHLGDRRDDVERLLRGAVERQARGVNVLVYGPPGTGKTEFCRVLAARVGLTLFAVGESDQGGDEPSRRERLAELRLAQSLLARDADGALLFDEMEDLLSGSTMSWPALLMGKRLASGSSRVFMNRLLEEAPVPTLWTTNAAGDMHPALLRRMMFALEMRQPSTQVRARVWARQLSSHGIDATPAQTLALAREFNASPGVAAGATAAAALSDGDFDSVRRGVRGLSRLIGCESRERPGAARFAPALLTADMDLNDLADRLANLGKRRFSLCLQGPPGTGKSAYARHLAERLGLEVMQRRASDLMDMYVGQTEKNIADAFAEARCDEAFLVFDEADSLLADRRGAQRNWEISQVNEMLTWMESHPLPFACTTNYAEKLDVAVLRRFTFKATLGYLERSAARTAFVSFFGLEAPPRLDELDCLTPGDFEVVRRKAEVLDELDNAAALLEMLRAECAAKPGHRAPVGFGPR